MSEVNTEAARKNPWALSLDVWAVLISLLAALLIRTGIVNRVPW